MLQYSNLRREITIQDWPYGNKRVKCHFYVETKGKKERAMRATVNPKTGNWNKPRKLTYASKVLFADGNDGKTYILQSVGWAISVMQSNMKLQEEYINVKDVRYQALADVFNQPVTTTVNVGE